MSRGPAEQEKSRAVVRGLHLEAMQEAGDARAAALREAETHLQRVGQLLPAALDAGLSLAEISRMTGVSRPTLYELRARYGDQRDLGLVFLQSVAVAGALPLRELASRLEITEGELFKVADRFEKQGHVEIEPDEDEDGTFAVALITPSGLNALDAWFELRRDEEEQS